MNYLKRRARQAAKPVAKQHKVSKREAFRIIDTLLAFYRQGVAPHIAAWFLGYNYGTVLQAFNKYQRDWYSGTIVPAGGRRIRLN